MPADQTTGRVDFCDHERGQENRREAALPADLPVQQGTQRSVGYRPRAGTGSRADAPPSGGPSVQRPSTKEPLDPAQQRTKPCAHMEFAAEVRVARLEDIGGFNAEVRIRCADCNRPFQFLGLQPGIDLAGARVSLDGLEANLAISPEGVKPNPLQRLAFGVRHHG